MAFMLKKIDFNNLLIFENKFNQIKIASST